MNTPPLPPLNPPLYTPLFDLSKRGDDASNEIFLENFSGISSFFSKNKKKFWKIFLGFRVFFQKIKKNFGKFFWKNRNNLLYFIIWE